jgi:hypothetical protein
MYDITFYLKICKLTTLNFDAIILYGTHYRLLQFRGYLLALPVTCFVSISLQQPRKILISILPYLPCDMPAPSASHSKHHYERLRINGWLNRRGKIEICSEQVCQFQHQSGKLDQMRTLKSKGGACQELERHQRERLQSGIKMTLRLLK